MRGALRRPSVNTQLSWPPASTGRRAAGARQRLRRRLRTIIDNRNADSYPITINPCLANETIHSLIHSLRSSPKFANFWWFSGFLSYAFHRMPFKRENARSNQPRDTIHIDTTASRESLCFSRRLLQRVFSRRLLFRKFWRHRVIINCDSLFALRSVFGVRRSARQALDLPLGFVWVAADYGRLGHWRWIGWNKVLTACRRLYTVLDLY